MKKLYTVLLILITIVSFNCQKELSHIETPGRGSNSTDPVTATVQGNVLDENGAPASGVTVNAGSKSAVTDAKGYFRIINAALDKNASLVTAEKNGYFKAYRTFQANEAANQVVIKLTKRKLTGTIKATGGEVVLDNGAKVALPASGVMKASGGAYSGDVRVFASYIDPAANDIRGTVPGSFMADNAANERVTLASFGMLAVELESPSGEKLQVATGKEATLTMPIPSSLQQSAPATIALWYVDEQTGIWKEQGSATRNGNNYVGNVKHFSFWNCDIGFPSVNLSLTLKNDKGIPLVHTTVRLLARINGVISQSYGFTDSLGGVSGLVPSGEAITLDVMNQECNIPAYSTTVGPFSTNTNLGSITVTPASNTVVTIKGKLVNCTGAPVKKGTAIIGILNTRAYVSADQNGEFSYVYIKCDNNIQDVSIVAIDNDASQQGAAAVFPVGTVAELNAGTLSACGVSTVQFINYTVDNQQYSLMAPEDSLTAWSRQFQQTWETSISGFNIGSAKQLYFTFSSPALTPGTYPIERISVNDLGSEVRPGSTVTVTRVSSTPGEYIEGTFSGVFTDSIATGPIKTVTGSFRLRK